MTSPCVLFANEPLVYRAAMAGAVGMMRPELDVRVVAPDDLAAAIAGSHPRFVVCSSLTEEIRVGVPAWLLLYPGGASVVEGEVAGRRVTSADIDLAGILDLIDRAMSASSVKG